MDEHDQRLRDIQRQYVDFLDDGQDGEDTYDKDVTNLILNNKCRLIVNLNDLRRKFPERAKSLLEQCFDEMLAFQRALKEMIGAHDAEYAKKCSEFFVGFEGSFGSRHLTPRTLTSRHLNNLVCVEGIVTSCSLVRPKVAISVHFCPTTNKTMERTYTDMTSVDAFPSFGAYPTQDEDGNALQTEYGLSTYKDYQTLTVQELPEKAPTGQLPRSIDVVCEHDLVDTAKPGDRIQIVAGYRCLPGKQGSYTSGTFRTILLANNIISAEQKLPTGVSGADVIKCKKLCKQRKDIFNLIASSLAPSIHGHEYVKKALLCLLLGGVEKILPNGSRLRGDINILLIGDPSVAKSQMLRYVLATNGRAVATTGRGSTGVGLTAAVTTDQDTGERRLEAGAMVLADRGIVCIDEFDKMTDMDRTAIHEVMEQGKVTIAKAGIHAQLNARCSVLAAANPVYGRYDLYRSPMENIGLQDSLLSRFDLLFVLLDTLDVDSDRRIANHVVKIHQYRAPGELPGSVTRIISAADSLATRALHENNTDQDKETVVWDKQDNLLYSADSRRASRLLSVDFVKKYIEIAKCMKPVLTFEVCEIIGEEYSRLRSQEWDGSNIARTQPVTARALETLIRLATAHAKARLSKTVNREDAETAIELVQFAYFKKVLEKEKKRSPVEEDEDPEGFIEESAEIESQDVPTPPPNKKAKHVTNIDVNISDEKLSAFKKSLTSLFSEKHSQSLELAAIKSKLKESCMLNDDEVMACFESMSDANQIMVSAGTVYLI